MKGEGKNKIGRMGQGKWEREKKKGGCDRERGDRSMEDGKEGGGDR